jgi:glutamate racemase
MWVPLVENGEYDSPGADYFIEKKVNELMEMDPLIDTIILGCTHYPVLQHKIEKYVPSNVTVVPQGKIVADSLKDYLCRHPEMDERLSKYGEGRFLTTESVEKFQASAKIFLNTDKTIDAHRIIF